MSRLRYVVVAAALGIQPFWLRHSHQRVAAVSGDGFALVDPVYRNLAFLRRRPGGHVVLLRQPWRLSVHGRLGLRRDRHAGSVSPVRRVRVPAQLQHAGHCGHLVLLREPRRCPDRRRLQCRRVRHRFDLPAVEADGSTSSTSSAPTTVASAPPTTPTCSATPVTSRSSVTSTATAKTRPACTVNQPASSTTATRTRPGIADNQFIYGDPGDRFVAGDWTGNGVDSPGSVPTVEHDDVPAVREQPGQRRRVMAGRTERLAARVRDRSGVQPPPPPVRVAASSRR